MTQNFDISAEEKLILEKLADVLYQTPELQEFLKEELEEWRQKRLRLAQICANEELIKEYLAKPDIRPEMRIFLQGQLINMQANKKN